ncbi:MULTISPECIES: hypothetical protein [Chitinophagaceae]
MIRTSFLFLVCLGFLMIGRAQQNEQKLYGVVKDSLTLTPIANVAIYNSTGKKSSYTGDGGLFQILANQGDTIRYYAPSFFDGYYVVQSKKLQMDTIQIWLRPKVKEDLPGVFVSTYTYKEYQADSTQRMKDFVENVGLKVPTFSTANSGAGVGIGLDALFSKKNKQKKKAYEIFKDDEQQRYIDFRFNKILVNHYSGLKGENLQKFMHDYRPTYEWLREHTDAESLKYYINDRLKLYFQRSK